MSAFKGPSAPPQLDGSGLRIAIVHASWNMEVVRPLVAGARKQLLAHGVHDSCIVVQSCPGSWELPFAVQRLFSASQVQSTSAGAPSATDLLASSMTDLASLSSSSAPAGIFDAIIAVGVLIKGETMHFEYIADAVSHGLMRVQLDAGIPVIFGLLTVLDEQQALARAGLGPSPGHNHGESWASAAVEMALKRHQLAKGVIDA